MKEAWSAALSRAKGDKVLDDPKRLRRSIKTDAKAKEKRVGAWKERAGKQKEAQAAKQQKCAPCLGGGGGKPCPNTDYNLMSLLSECEMKCCSIP